jgi:hypothetical protein
MPKVFQAALTGGFFMSESYGLQENIIANYFQKCYNFFKKGLPKNRRKAQYLSVSLTGKQKGGI